MIKKDTFGLVCSGGGAHGAYQVGVLKYIHEKFSYQEASPFRIFAGSSCGALNTTFYAAQSWDAVHSRLWLEDMWLHFHVPGYHGNIVKNMMKSLYQQWRNKHDERMAAWSLLSPAPMKDIIQKGFQRAHLDKAFSSQTTLGAAIAATELVSGRCCWFQEGETASEWNLFHSIGIQTKLTPAHLEASCSVPIFLPPVKIDKHYYVDGSVGMDRPLAAAVIMGATRILTIATDQPVSFQLPEYPPTFRPKFSNMFRMLMNRLSRDPARDEAVQLQLLNRFYLALSRRKKKQGGKDIYPLFHDESLPSHYKPVHVYMFYPSKRIRDYYGLEKHIPGAPKRTRFMFHNRFIHEMIELGYEDAHSRHQELKDFFIPPANKRWLFFRRQHLKDKAA